MSGHTSPTPAATEIPAAAASPSVARAGVMYGLAAYLAWGISPLYFKQVVQHAPSFEILAQRLIWSAVFVAGLIVLNRQWAAVGRILFRSPRTLGILLVTTALVSVNWFVFIWVHEVDMVLQASLGYFINPLISVLLGFIFLGERLRPWQGVGVGLAFVGVVLMTVAAGEPPTIALLLAVTFALYGLLRKIAAVEALVGLMIETMLLTPLCLLYIWWLFRIGQSSFAAGQPIVDFLLIMGGLVTALPLLWFNCAARRLRLMTIGFLQYLAPTGQFLIAVLIFGEELTLGRLGSFAVIWLALAIYPTDTVLASRRARPPAHPTLGQPSPE